MEELKIEYLPFASLVPSPNNSRAHSPEQIAQIASSIKQFGFNVPIAIDDKRNILAGEGRYLAVRSMAQYKKKVPTICLAHLTEAQRRAYIIADNQIALNSTWDEKKLTAELFALIDQDFNIGSLGFNEDQLKEIIKNPVHLEKISIVSGHTRTTGGEKPADGKGKTRRLAVLVYCETAQDQEELYGQLTDKGFECKNTVI